MLRSAMVGGLLAASLSAQAAPGAAAAECRAHLDALDFEEKSIALINADSIGDDSAIRETMRQNKIQSLQQSEQMELSMLSAKHCRLPKTAPDGGVLYLVAAIKCSEARRTADDDADEKCDMRRWKPVK